MARQYKADKVTPNVSSKLRKFRRSCANLKRPRHARTKQIPFSPIATSTASEQLSAQTRALVCHSFINHDSSGTAFQATSQGRHRANELAVRSRLGSNLLPTASIPMSLRQDATNDY